MKSDERIKRLENEMAELRQEVSDFTLFVKALAQQLELMACRFARYEADRGGAFHVVPGEEDEPPQEAE